MKTHSLTLFSALAISAVVGCSSPASDESSTAAGAISPSGNLDELKEQFPRVFSDANVAAFCVAKSGDSYFPVLTIRRSRPETSALGSLSGPSLGHEPHISGEIVRIVTPSESNEEGVITHQLENGKVLQVAGEGNQPAVTVSSVRFVSLLDDAAHREVRDQVQLNTSQGTQTFDRCWLGPGSSADSSEKTPAAKLNIDALKSQFGPIVSAPNLAAFCVAKSGDSYFPVLTIRRSRPDASSLGRLSGPSSGHEPHIFGEIDRIVTPSESNEEGVITHQLKNGKVIQVAGEGNQPAVTVSSVRFVSLLDDAAHREVRDQVQLETSKGPQTFDRCWLGPARE